MRPGLFLLLLVAALLAPASAPADEAAPRGPRIVLVGDSTVTDRLGWGRVFRLFTDDGVEVVNTAVAGRSSKSFRAEGRWTEALALKGDYYLIQFGHNDQPGKGPDRETKPATTYRENLALYVDEARAAGAQPVLVTPLTRRTFQGGRIRSTLAPYAEAVKAVGAAKGVPVVDLHARSIELAERMGERAWDAISPREPAGPVDRTHLTRPASALVAPLVVAGLRAAVPALAAHLRAEPLGGVAAARRLANAVVSAEGHGTHRTLQQAIDAIPPETGPERPWTVFVTAGRYRETVDVPREKRFVHVVGEDPASTVLTFDLQAGRPGLDGSPLGGLRTATLTIDAEDFVVENLTVENTAGPGSLALALRVDGDRVVFRNSRFLGWQGTVFLNRGRQLFEDCVVAGDQDFVFGGATALFERSRLHVRRDGFVAAATTPPAQRHGFVFAGGSITGAPGAKAYLGRPGRAYAHTAFVGTTMSAAVRPEGWFNGDRSEREKTARFEEGGNTGPGASPAQRVRWVRVLGPAEVAALGPATVLAGPDGWDPAAQPAYPSPGKAEVPADPETTAP